MKKNKYFWIVGIIGLVLDQITKYWVVVNFDSVGESWTIIPGIFSFTYVRNTGAAFSFFEGGVVWLRWLSLLVSLGLIFYAWFGMKMKLPEQLGYGFLFAGAFGNGVDRFLFGYVVDFLHFTLINFPVFNLADIFINIGIVFLFISNLPNPKRRER